MSAPPIVVLHGFAGHADSWNAVRSALPGRSIEALTLFGHDERTVPAGLVAFDEEVGRVAALIRGLGRPVRLCGYSMGGRIALGVLAQEPELVSSAILVGAHPGLTTEVERDQRAVADEVWVRVLENEGVATFAEKWQAQPLFATQEHLPPSVLAAQRAIRLRHHAHSLALAMTSLGLARMPSYWDVLGRLEIPVDLVVGALDDKFTALALRMKERLGPDRGRVLRVREAGHNVLLERPAVLAQIVASDRSTVLAPEIAAV